MRLGAIGARAGVPSPRTGGDRGLTTLEWLLIVAAVAGIAALAVVLVQGVVSDTSERIAGNNARAVAARLAGEQIVSDSTRPANSQPVNLLTWYDWERFYELRCKRLEITYGDAGISVVASFDVPSTKETHRLVRGSGSGVDPILSSIADNELGYEASCIVN